MLTPAPFRNQQRAIKHFHLSFHLPNLCSNQYLSPNSPCFCQCSASVSHVAFHCAVSWFFLLSLEFHSIDYQDWFTIPVFNLSVSAVSFPLHQNMLTLCFLDKTKPLLASLLPASALYAFSPFNQDFQKSVYFHFLLFPPHLLSSYFRVASAFFLPSRWISSDHHIARYSKQFSYFIYFPYHQPSAWCLFLS